MNKAFGVMAYRYYQKRREAMAYTCGTLALLFQPYCTILEVTKV